MCSNDTILPKPLATTIEMPTPTPMRTIAKQMLATTLPAGCGLARLTSAVPPVP
jgi:hypothetical protein